ncbi:28S ribosomal protein S35, mitochondrial-like, partial [Daphnia pulex]|uniref:28S ribosomal protein S35, mitochondrial-like n=1 Tax=Daphnia pulex TaxID=6669 RepID=UPI001EDFBFAC
AAAVVAGSTTAELPPPGKFANAELLKIPNFLHLTPPAIERQCQASKKICTEWPKELDTNEKIENHLPITITTSDYLHSSPSLRDARSIIVTLQVKSSSLKSDNHAKDKLLRLVKERYNLETDVLTIVSERCPLRMQNVNYAMYLLNVFVSKSWKTEPWEDKKCEADMENMCRKGASRNEQWSSCSDECRTKRKPKTCRRSSNSTQPMLVYRVCSRSCCPLWYVVAAYAGYRSFYIKFNWPFGAGVVLPKLHYYFMKLALCQCSIPLIC